MSFFTIVLAVVRLFIAWSLFFTVKAESATVLCSSLFEQPGHIPGEIQDAELPWFRKIQFRSIEKILKTGRIVSIDPLELAFRRSGIQGSGSTPGLALITFADGTRAIWKPGVKNLSEVAAYKAARLVNSRLVPPTVERHIGGIVGSLQYFVEAQDLKNLSKEERDALWQQVPISQRAARDIFNFVFGNWDLHWGNVLIDASRSIAQIDNTQIRSRQNVRFGERPFILRMKYSDSAKKNSVKGFGSFPFDQAIYLRHPSFDDVIKVIKPYADPKDLDRWLDGRRKYTWRDVSVGIVFWDQGVWIQAIGFQDYGAIKPPAFPEEVIAGYRGLTFENLRAIMPDEISDIAIREMLGRRDQVLKAAELAK